MTTSIFFDDDTQALQTFHEGRHDEYRWIASVNYLLTDAAIDKMQVVMKAMARLNEIERRDLEERLTTFRHLQALCTRSDTSNAGAELESATRRGFMGFGLKRA